VALAEEINAALRVPFANYDALASLLGVWVWGAILRRELLAVFFVIFRQMDRCTSSQFVFWKSARAELRLMRDLIPMMVMDVGLGVAPALFATDASGGRDGDCGGRGVAATPAT